MCINTDVDDDVAVVQDTGKLSYKEVWKMMQEIQCSKFIKIL